MLAPTFGVAPHQRAQHAGQQLPGMFSGRAIAVGNWLRHKRPPCRRICSSKAAKNEHVWTVWQQLTHVFSGPRPPGAEAAHKHIAQPRPACPAAMRVQPWRAARRPTPKRLVLQGVQQRMDVHKLIPVRTHGRACMQCSAQGMSGVRGRHIGR